MTSLPIHPHQPPPEVDNLDPANAQLADALRKSFRVLKLLMFVLVILYFLSGWFSVKPGEVGVVLRYGRVVGGSSAVLPSGWHWSWPYPIERWLTVPTGERELPVEFMFQLTDEEKVSGSIKGYRYDNLSPARDDYLITGDVNLLHAALVIKYRIADPVAYLANVFPMADPAATLRSDAHRRAPEYSLLRDIVRDAVIQTAAAQEALLIRGNKQSEFLQAVAANVRNRFKAYDAAGTPLGLELDPAAGVIAPKIRNIEGILPPRQTQEAFEGVDKAQAAKVVAVTKADSDSQELLLRTAGTSYPELADSVNREFLLLREGSAAQSAGDEKKAEAARLSAELAKQRAETEKLLLAASGDVQKLIKRAEIERDRMVKDAAADFSQFQSMLPEYTKNPDIFLSRLAAETYARTMGDARISKMLVSENAGKIWIRIPRSGKAEAPARGPTKEDQPGVIKDTSGEVSIRAQ